MPRCLKHARKISASKTRLVIEKHDGALFHLAAIGPVESLFNAIPKIIAKA